MTLIHPSKKASILKKVEGRKRCIEISDAAAMNAYSAIEDCLMLNFESPIGVATFLSGHVPPENCLTQ